MAEDLDFAPAFMLGTQTACNSGSRESNAFSQPSGTHMAHTHTKGSYVQTFNTWLILRAPWSMAYLEMIARVRNT